MRKILIELHRREVFHAAGLYLAASWIIIEVASVVSAIALHELGRTAQARAALDRLIETDADGAAFQIAEVYAQWGRADDAFEWLERGYSQGDSGLAELRSSASLEPLYVDPRFNPLLAKVGLPTLD